MQCSPPNTLYIIFNLHFLIPIFTANNSKQAQQSTSWTSFSEQQAISCPLRPKPKNQFKWKTTKSLPKFTSSLKKIETEDTRKKDVYIDDIIERL